MEIVSAIQKAIQVLDEETVRPTLKYREVELVSLEDSELSIYDRLDEKRGMEPREVEENPKGFAFASTNHDLLLRILNQVAADNRPSFVTQLIGLLLAAAPVHQCRGRFFPQFRGHTSSLSLLAEFSIRIGHLDALLSGIDAITEIKLAHVVDVPPDLQPFIAEILWFRFGLEISSPPPRLC